MAFLTISCPYFASTHSKEDGTGAGSPRRQILVILPQPEVELGFVGSLGFEYDRFDLERGRWDC